MIKTDAVSRYYHQVMFAFQDNFEENQISEKSGTEAI